MHSPRPWTVKVASEGYYYIVDASGVNVCACGRREDALLIAQAPEFLWLLDGEDRDPRDTTARDVELAIGRAKGELS